MSEDAQHSPPRIIPLWRAGLPVAWATLLALASCTPQPAPLQRIHQRGTLRLVTLNAPTSYYLGAQGPEGLEYRLAERFARSLGVRLAVQTVADAAAMRAALDVGSADLAAAQITADAAWRRVGLVSATYEDVPQLLIHARGKSHARDITQLGHAHLVVRADSPQLQLLRELRGGGLGALTWTALARDESDPLDWVSEGQADYAVVDANEFRFTQHLYPEVNLAFALPATRPIQWLVPRAATDLLDAVNHFFTTARDSGELARIQAEANAESDDFDYQEAHQFQVDVAALLPPLQIWFEQAAAATGLDWRLLAAVGYQESKWQSHAQSADGALGIMMLTADAAATVGVTDRSNPQQNILGGARYLVQVIGTIPTRIADPDRTWFALAAYNVGYGHLEDARILAQMRGKNPDSWKDVREQLPLLAEERWFTRLKRGYARGWEPANFVDQVRQYLAVLEWTGANAPGS